MWNIMISCKKATQFASEKLDRKLSFGERMALRLHLALCGPCDRIDRQFQLLRHAMARYVDRSSDTGDSENP